MPDFVDVNYVGGVFTLDQGIPGRNMAGQYGAYLDRSAFDAMLARLGFNEAAASVAFDPAVAKAAERTQEMVAADTPVDTGLLKASWEMEHVGPSAYDVKNEAYYASLVEARAPGGPEKYHGAMIAQNLAKIETVLMEEVEAQALLLAGALP